MQNLKSGLLVFGAVFFITFLSLFLFGSGFKPSLIVSMLTGLLFYIFYLVVMEI